jgi:hypothetical protein
MQDGEDFANFTLKWWNAEYKEPTIRNCFGCKHATDNHNQDIEECHLCMWENQYTPTTKNYLGVLDKIRAEIETKYGQCKLCEFDSDYDGVYTDIGDIADILQIIDKYKAEREG